MPISYKGLTDNNKSVKTVSPVGSSFTLDLSSSENNFVLDLSGSESYPKGTPVYVGGKVATTLGTAGPQH